MKHFDFINWIKLFPQLPTSFSSSISEHFQSLDNSSSSEILSLEKNIYQILVGFHSEKDLYSTLLEDLCLKCSSIIESDSNTTMISCTELIGLNNHNDLVNATIDLRDIIILLMSDIDNWMCLTIMNLSDSLTNLTIPITFEKLNRVCNIGIDSLLRVAKSQSIDSNIRMR